MEMLSEKFKEKLDTYSDVDIQNLLERLQALDGVGPAVSEYLEFSENMGMICSEMTFSLSEELYDSSMDEYFKAA